LGKYRRVEKKKKKTKKKKKKKGAGERSLQKAVETTLLCFGDWSTAVWFKILPSLERYFDNNTA